MSVTSLFSSYLSCVMYHNLQGTTPLVLPIFLMVKPRYPKVSVKAITKAN